MAKRTKNLPQIPLLHCSFCGKSQRDVRALIAGPNAYICNECIALCNEILQEVDQAKGTQPSTAPPIQ